MTLTTVAQHLKQECYPGAKVGPGDYTHRGEYPCDVREPQFLDNAAFRIAIRADAIEVGFYVQFIDFALIRSEH